MITLIAAMLIGGFGQGTVSTPPPQEPIASANFAGERMRNALFKFKNQAGIKLRYECDIVEGIVDLSFINLPVSDLLAKILANARPRLAFRVENGEYVIFNREPIVNLDTAKGPAKLMIEDLIAQAERQDPKWVGRIGVEIDNSVEAPKLVGLNQSITDALRQVADHSSPRCEIIEEPGHYRVVPRLGAGSPTLVAQPGHQGAVTAVCFSQDGRFMASMGSEGRINVWNVRDGKTARTIRGLIGSEAFTANGKQLILAYQRGVFALDLDTGKFRQIARTPREIRQLAFAPLANIVVSDDGAEAVAWNIETGQPIKRWTQTSPPFIVAIDRGGEKVALGLPVGPRTRRPSVTLASLGSGRDALAFELPSRPLRLAFNRNGTSLAVGMESGVATLYSAITGGFLRGLVPLPSPPERRTSFPFALSADEKYFSYLSTDGKVELRDVLAEKPVLSLKTTLNAGLGTRSIAFAPDGKHILVGRETYDQVTEKIGLYRVGDGKLFMKFTGGASQVLAVRFVDQGAQLVAIDGEGARIWNTAMEVPPRFLSCGRVTVQPTSRDRTILVGNDPATKKFATWDVQSGKKFVADGPISNQAVTEAIWSGDGTQVVVRDQSDKIQVWSVKSPITVSFTTQNHPIRRMLTNRDASRVLTIEGTKEISATLWDGINARPIRTWSPADKVEDQVAAASLGPYFCLVIAGETHVITWFKAEEVTKFEGTEPSMSAGGGLLALQIGNRCEFRNLIGNTSFRTDPGEFHPEIHPGGDTWVTFSPDREVAYVYGKRGKTTIRGHEGPINGIDIHPEGFLIASAGSDGTVRLWGPDGRQRVRLQAGNSLAVGGALDDRDSLRSKLSKTDFVAVLNDNTYMASKAAAQTLTFRSGNNTYPFDQFDLRLNRPDLVMAEIGLAQPNAIILAANAYRKRLTLLDINETDLSSTLQAPAEPTFITEPARTTLQPYVDLHLKLYDQFQPLDRLNITVNGIPIFGTKGMSLREYNNREIIDPPVRVSLSRGRNLFRVSTLNKKGAESTKLPFVITREDNKARPPNLYLVSVGVSKYDDPDYRLEAPAFDAAKIAAVFKTLVRSNKPVVAKPLPKPVPVRRSKRLRRRSGRFSTYTYARYQPAPPAPPVNPYGKVFVRLLPDKLATRANIQASREFLKDATEDDVVVFFFSGHGVLDAYQEYFFLTVDFDIDALRETAMSYNDIERLMDGVRPRKRLVLLDTCNSGQSEAIPKQLERLASQTSQSSTVVAKPIPVPMKKPKKGAKDGGTAYSASNEFLMMQQLFAGLENNSGATVIGASAAGEETQDKGAKGFGLLTWGVVQAIQGKKADLNRDGHISVTELRTYLLENVVSSSGNHKQATSRAENPDLDFFIR